MPLMWLVILASLGAVVWVLARQAARRRATAIELPACGACGYCLRGLETHYCPECGSALMEVGIIAAGTPRAKSPLHPAVAWSFICLVGYILTGVLLWNLLPGPSISRGRQVMTLQQPNSGSHSAITFTQAFRAREGIITDAVTAMVAGALESPDEPITLVVEPARFRAALVQGDSTIAENLPLTRSTILDWFERNKVGASPREMAAEADAVLLALANPSWTQTKYGGGWSSSSGGSEPTGAYRMMNTNSSGSTAFAPAWYHIAFQLAAIAIWLAGLFIIIRRSAAAGGGAERSP